MSQLLKMSAIGGFWRHKPLVFWERWDSWLLNFSLLQTSDQKQLEIFVSSPVYNINYALPHADNAELTH